MRHKLFWIIPSMAVITLLAMLLLTAPAHAGGWVVITLDDLPAGVRAGETVHLGFTVRQHGQTPIDTVSPVALARNQETGETVRVEAEKGDGAGRFTLAIVFPAQGVWDVRITAEPFGQTLQLPPITVLLPAASDTAASAASAPAGTGEVRAILRWVGFGLLAAAALLVALSTRRQPDRHEPETLTPRPSD